MTRRRLVGYIWNCGYQECGCMQPKIEEEILGLHEEVVSSLPFWEGTFAGNPVPSETADLEEELRAACYKHRMSVSEDDPNVYYREIKT